MRSCNNLTGSNGSMNISMIVDQASSSTKVYWPSLYCIILVFFSLHCMIPLFMYGDMRFPPLVTSEYGFTIILYYEFCEVMVPIIIFIYYRMESVGVYVSPCIEAHLEAHV